MGEPLDNLTNVSRAIAILNSSRGLGIAARRITVSTCGLVPGIRAFRNLGLQVELSVSLHAARDELRDRLVPVNRKYPLESLLKACEEFERATGRKLTLEYVLIKDVNDSLEDGRGLAAVAQRLKAKINLIAYSSVPSLDFKAPRKEDIRKFMDLLERMGVSVTLRRSKGSDIQAACGQLAGRAQDRDIFR
jgi:23S rRNA (adenine2503-C2)-methyltransferase